MPHSFSSQGQKPEDESQDIQSSQQPEASGSATKSDCSILSEAWSLEHQTPGGPAGRHLLECYDETTWANRALIERNIPVPVRQTSRVIPLEQNDRETRNTTMTTRHTHTVEKLCENSGGRCWIAVASLTSHVPCVSESFTSNIAWIMVYW